MMSHAFVVHISSREYGGNVLTSFSHVNMSGHTLRHTLGHALLSGKKMAKEDGRNKETGAVSEIAP